VSSRGEVCQTESDGITGVTTAAGIVTTAVDAAAAPSVSAKAGAAPYKAGFVVPAANSHAQSA
jgi:hypothetical protein